MLIGPRRPPTRISSFPGHQNGSLFNIPRFPGHYNDWFCCISRFTGRYNKLFFNIKTSRIDPTGFPYNIILFGIIITQKQLKPIRNLHFYRPGVVLHSCADLEAVTPFAGCVTIWSKVHMYSHFFASGARW